MNILIVHGPNLNLLGEAKGDVTTYAALNARLESFARELNVSVKIVQSNHEGALVDTLQSERHWADAILINPAALTHTSYSLRECLRIVGRPAIEVHLEDIRRRETWRRKSVIKDVCEAQVMGKGLLSYLDALERLAKGKYGGLRKGQSKAAAAEHAPLTAPPKLTSAPVRTPTTKTIGRVSMASGDPGRLLKEAIEAAPAPHATKTLGKTTPVIAPPPGRQLTKTSLGITRSVVRERIAARLGGKISPSALATWAREQWLNVERGAATEMGQRELLEEALQALALSATPAGQLSENELVDLMARLG
ncbi:MAG: 3-dehydroquinate dehydratase [Deltaproteobacteria bacterium]|nr:3-dehydroquinate dehydratase [Deltaproteobacteria bacterium]